MTTTFGSLGNMQLCMKREELRNQTSCFFCLYVFSYTASPSLSLVEWGRRGGGSECSLHCIGDFKEFFLCLLSLSKVFSLERRFLEGLKSRERNSLKLLPALLFPPLLSHTLRGLEWKERRKKSTGMLQKKSKMDFFFALLSLFTLS